jgi:cytochrome c peroxidase
VRDTAPVTWSDGVASVADEAMLTSQERMGGSGLSMGQAEHIEAYVNWTRHVDHADKGAVTAQVQRGGEIFARADVGCASCHAGPTYSNPLSYDVVDNACANTPTLVGIAATPPYFHDGSAATLRDVLEASRDGGMGDTSMLSNAELDDLEAFLRSL